MTRLPKTLTRELDASGFPWIVEMGRGDHMKIKLAGRLVGVVGTSVSGNHRRGTLNVRAQIRRAIAELKGTP